MFNYFLCIRSCTRGKDCDVCLVAELRSLEPGVFRRMVRIVAHIPGSQRFVLPLSAKPSYQLIDISFKKFVLAKQYTDEDDHYGPYDCDDQNVNDHPYPSVFNGQIVHEPATHVSCQAATDCKRAQDKSQLKTANVPFSL